MTFKIFWEENVAKLKPLNFPMNVSIGCEGEISNSICVTMMLIVLIAMVCDMLKVKCGFWFSYITFMHDAWSYLVCTRYDLFTTHW